MAEHGLTAAIEKFEAMVESGLEPFQVGEKRLWVVPEGYRLEMKDFAADAPSPARKKGIATMRDVPSFIEYVKRHAGPGTVAWVDDLKLTGILNGHAVGSPEDGAGWGDHKAVFEPKYSPAWTAWIGFNGGWQSQGEFAQFLETRLTEIAEPAGAEVLEAVKNLRLKYDTTYERAVETSNDLVQLVWKEEAETGTIKIPAKLVLYLKMYEGGERYVLTARVRFQKPDSQGKVKFRYELGEELHDIKLKAQQDLRDQLADGLGDEIPVFVGAWAAS